MAKLPEHIDINALVDNLRSATRIFTIKGIARAAGIPHNKLSHIRSNDTTDHRWSTLAPLVNLHMKVCPDVPIPEKKR